MKILSINISVIGHATYRRTLEAAFAANFPDIIFRSVPLSEGFNHHFLGRALFALNVRRLPCFESGDLDFYRLRSEVIISWVAARWVRKYLRREKADVVHFHTRSIALFAAAACGNTPFVIDTDTTNAALANYRHREPQYSYRPLIALEARQYAQASRIIAWSEHTRASLIKDYGVSAERVCKIHPGLPSEFFDPIWETRQNRVHSGKVRILFIGNDFKRKGGFDLVEVFTRELSANAELHLVTNAVDVGADHPAIFVHRGITPLSDRLRDLFITADIFTLPTHEDTIPMALPEAMAAGLPCVSTAIFGIPEAIIHGDNGFNITPGDLGQLTERLRTLIADPALRVKMGQRSRTLYLQNFNPKTNVARMIEVFRDAQKDKPTQ